MTDKPLSQCMTLSEFTANVTEPALAVFAAEVHAEYLRLTARHLNNQREREPTNGRR